MSDPYVGEIRLFGFPRVPDGWLACNGQLVPIASYDVLYSLIGTAFGGDGAQTFGLPDLRGRVPISQGQGTGLPNYTVGQPGGEEQHPLRDVEMPSHGHALLSSTDTDNVSVPAQNVHLATASGGTLYAPTASAAPYGMMAAASVGAAGNNLPHDNMMPTVVGNFCIAYAGAYPPHP